jgi:hypothetical protein
MGTHLVLAKTETGSRLKHFYEFPPFRRGPLLVLLVIDSACKDSGRTALSRGSRRLDLHHVSRATVNIIKNLLLQDQFGETVRNP